MCKEEGVPQNEVRNIDKLASLPQHPNVMRVFRYGFLTSYRPSPEPHKHLPYYYFDMDLGRLSLYKYIETHFHVNPQIIPSPANLWDILSQVTSAVEYLHRNNLVHRDIKPDNSKPLFQNPSHFSFAFANAKSSLHGQNPTFGYSPTLESRSFPLAT